MNFDMKRIIHSLWIIPTFLFCINGLPLLYVGLRAKKLKWTLIGIIAEMPYIIFTILVILEIENENLNMILVILMIASPIVTILYSLSIRNEYLNIVYNNQPNIYTYNNYNNQNQIRTHKQENNSQLLTDDNPIRMINSQENVVNNISRININTAKLDEIKQLPGINIILAKKILNARNQGIVFKNIEELGDYLDISPGTMQRLSPYLSFNTKDNINTHQRRLDV